MNCTWFELVVALHRLLRRRVRHIRQPGSAGLAELSLPVTPEVFQESDDASDLQSVTFNHFVLVTLSKEARSFYR